MPAGSGPDLSNLLRVIRSEKAFRSSAVSSVSLPAGALFAKITGATTAPHRTYSTVQAGRDVNIELNSDLLYVNHSCDPSLEFDMASYEVRVARQRPLREGDKLTFFYPSTEWTMAQPFDCECDAPKESCLGRIDGAQNYEDALLRHYWLNEHIEALLEERSFGQQHKHLPN